jgi:hypothetical protein
MKAQGIGQATSGRIAGMQRFFNRCPHPQQVLGAEKDEGQIFKECQDLSMTDFDRRYRLQDHGEHIAQNHQGQDPGKDPGDFSVLMALVFED